MALTYLESGSFVVPFAVAACGGPLCDGSLQLTSGQEISIYQSNVFVPNHHKGK